VRVGLKTCRWEHLGDTTVLVCDPSRAIELEDPDGQVARLLTVLQASPGTAGQVHAALAASGSPITAAELAAAFSALDELGILCDPDRHGVGRESAGRYFSNLAFFDLYARLGVPDSEFQHRLGAAHVLQLGAGGLGSNVIQNLAGLGVGKLTLLDNDVVEPRNLARQFLYREDDIGQPKVSAAANWVRRFHSGIDVTAVRRWVGAPADLTELLPGVDLVVSGIDQPDQIDEWVNQACVSAGVPWVRGGMAGSRLIYYSVDPGRSACFACRVAAYGNGSDVLPAALSGTSAVAQRLSARLPRVNRAIGPAAALIGSLVAFEAVRYLTGYEPPFGAGADVMIDVTGGCQQRREEWPRDPACTVCSSARQLQQA
jgi:molybdopterin/thiamine biosynthesis adenylyltransferase